MLNKLIIPIAIEHILFEFKIINHLNREKIKECVDTWLKAKELPRKQKKRIRNQANKDYYFWIKIDKWYQEINPFIE